MKRTICVLTVIIILIILGLYKSGIALFEYKGRQEGAFEATIISKKIQKRYTVSYQVEIENKKFILYIKSEKDFEIGDKIKFEGTYNKTSGQRNFGGFDYNLYLKTKKIYGVFNGNNVEKIYSKDKRIKFKFKKIILNIQEYIANILQNNLPKDNYALLKGLLIGQKDDIETQVIEDFRDASLSHVLAISGAHFSYIILALTFINKRLKCKNLGNIISILVILFFIHLTGATPSVIRAGTMSILVIFAKLLHRKSDFWTNLSLSLLIQLIYNPYVIFDLGLILSYCGVIGIVIFYKIIQSKVKIKIVSVTISANLAIMPIMMYNFNTISLSFILSNLIVSIILGPIIILGFVSIIFRFKFIYFILNILLNILSKTANICANIPFSKIYVSTPSLISILVFYLLLFTVYKKKSLLNKDTLKKDMKLIKLKNKKIKNVITTQIILIIFFNINFQMINASFKHELLINFIVVGQGDSTLVRIGNTTLMIDSGGTGATSSYDIGKNTILPYLLDRKITKLDYIMISHFDADHCQGFMYVMRNLKVKNAIICKQAEDSDLYQEFLKITNERSINIIYVQNGNSLQIGKNSNKIELKILHPQRDLISNNPLNNNAIVFKLIYKSFKMLFTGDIEKEAENLLLSNYFDLKATVLKVGHHGSKTSSTQEFLEKVSPKIALIGVGQDNKFGHPSSDVIERLKNQGAKIYRTDEDGEISILINNKGKIKICKRQ